MIVSHDICLMIGALNLTSVRGVYSAVFSYILYVDLRRECICAIFRLICQVSMSKFTVAHMRWSTADSFHALFCVHFINASTNIPNDEITNACECLVVPTLNQRTDFRFHSQSPRNSI